MSHFLAGADSLVEVFDRVASARPDAPCLVDDHRTFTYREVRAASARLASRLTAAGVCRGDIVALLLDRGADVPIAILAVLRAGAAYLPLDPGYPADRLRYVAGDAAVRFAVGSADRVRDLGLAGVITVDPAEGGGEADSALRAPTSDDAAYVIYTSGSTGRPKGCVISHGNVLALLRAALPLFAVDQDDRWSLFHSHAFDFSVWELWGALATGATAVLVPGQTAQLPHEFLDFLVRHRITVLNQVPSVFRFLTMTYADSARPPLALRYLVFGGESVELDVTRAFLGHLSSPAPTVVNMYGITEITVHATAKVLTGVDLDGAVRSPIGKPLPHLTIDVRGEDLAPVAVGESGELWIAGAGVAAGYLDRPELTAQRFVTLDTPAGPRRYYRTGDLARVLPDGELEFLGRNDQQVKLRGFRVELGEIEATLRAHDAVRDVAATVITTAAGAQFLVACVVSAGDPVPDGAELAATLRAHARTGLPAHMVPDRYVVVPALPLTPSGKLDRGALPALARPARAVSPRR